WTNALNCSTADWALSTAALFGSAPWAAPTDAPTAPWRLPVCDASRRTRLMAAAVDVGSIVSMLITSQRKMEEGGYPFLHACACWRPRLLKQRENRLRQLLGLGQDCSTGLLQHLVLRQVGGFCSVVGVHDPAAGSRGIFRDVLQVVDGVVEAVLHRTKVGALGVDTGQSVIHY